MVKVEVCSILESGAKITLNDTIDLWLTKDKYKEIILAQRTSEGAESYYFHYYALRCEVSEGSAQELIALGVKVVDLKDLKSFRM